MVFLQFSYFKPHHYLIGSLLMRSVVLPFTRKTIGRMVIIDPSQRATLKMECEWIEIDCDHNDLIQYLQAYRFRLEKLIKEAEKINFPIGGLKSIENMCTTYGVKYIDLRFGPVDKSIGKIVKAFPMEWRRANDFLGSNVDVFSGSIEPDDIKQGCLGDCWFLSAIAALS